MDQNPFAHLNLKQTEEAERKARAAHPYLFRLAELVARVESAADFVGEAIRSADQADAARTQPGLF